MTLTLAAFIYLAIGAYLHGHFGAKLKTTDDLWIFAGICALWLLIAFSVAGEMVAEAAKRERVS